MSFRFFFAFRGIRSYRPISLILAKFTNALVKSRPLKEIGAEQVYTPCCFTSPPSPDDTPPFKQLLIDLQIIKAYLLRLPGEPLSTARRVFLITINDSRVFFDPSHTL